MLEKQPAKLHSYQYYKGICHDLFDSSTFRSKMPGYECRGYCLGFVGVFMKCLELDAPFRCSSEGCGVEKESW